MLLAATGVKMVAWERGRYYIGGKLSGFELPRRVFPCMTPAQVGGWCGGPLRKGA